ncbi:hypothetical protein [Amycolatopsis sp. WGS_07]|uniref:hypothetical protein n=1 Tax=Amycolatopsis sp. WGS_07 TaxID=3076764 RepID=UPI00387348C4
MDVVVEEQDPLPAGEVGDEHAEVALEARVGAAQQAFRLQQLARREGRDSSETGGFVGVDRAGPHPGALRGEHRVARPRVLAAQQQERGVDLAGRAEGVLEIGAGRPLGTTIASSGACGASSAATGCSSRWCVVCCAGAATVAVMGGSILATRAAGSLAGSSQG